MESSAIVKRLMTNTERIKSWGKKVPPGTTPLDKGEPDFETPEHICDAAREAMRQGYTHYCPGQGDQDLIEAICENMNRECSCDLSPEGVIITNGAMEAIYLACSAYLSPGDELIMFSPGYSYVSSALMLDAVPVWVSLAEDFSLDQDALKRAITPKTKAIIFCNPSNPTGKSFTLQEMEFLVETAMKNNLLLISDEAYHKLYYDDKTHVSAGRFTEARKRIVVIDSFSKSYAMTGWRLGYVAGAPELIKPMFLIHKPTLISINVPAQRAGLAALKGPQDCVSEMLTEYDRRRKTLIEKLTRIPGITCERPDSAFYFFPRFEADMTSAEMLDYLYEKKVAVRSGSEFGPAGEGYLRLCFAVPYETVVEGIERLEAAFKELR
jgi:aspartate/methionine/tyrosine aminotransferase